MEPAPIEKLLEAFKVLDIDNKGYVTKDFMAKVMSEECEPFSQEELEEMFSAAVDGSSNKIPYEYYLNQLMVDIWIFKDFLLLHKVAFENKNFLHLFAKSIGVIASIYYKRVGVAKEQK